ncbi:MAG: hypothetical protein RMJ98_10585 [Myxococcales bacterium]|nr:hypothetical protein [Polyangiaceae bacterium]MDW8249732.1 hypothetical protein [Myxococcales bacterium]
MSFLGYVTGQSGLGCAGMIGAEIVETALGHKPELLCSLVLQLTDTGLEGPLTPLPGMPLPTFQGPRGWVALRILEVPKEEDRATWPLLLSEVERQVGSSGDLLVLTSSRDTARWARKVLQQEGPLGTRRTLVPAVLRVGLDEAEALLAGPMPHAALISAWGIQRKDGPRTRAALAKILGRIDEIPGAERSWWLWATLQLLSATQLAHIRAMRNDLPRSEAFSQFVSAVEAQAEARGKARSLLRFLELRKIPLSPEQRSFIEGCTDLPTANRWVEEVFSAERNGTMLEAIFRVDSPPPASERVPEPPAVDLQTPEPPAMEQGEAGASSGCQ